MNRCLRDKAVREGDKEDATDKGGNPEKEKIPMEAARLI